jgi:nicotinamidase-related amidase
MFDLKIDSNKTVLAVIDVQKGIVALDRKLEPYNCYQPKQKTTKRHPKIARL